MGASAGGVEALLTLLPALSPHFRGAVFAVLHLPRQRPSLLTDVFAPHCPLPVREAEDKEPVRAGVFYIAPPDYHLLIDAGPCLALSDDEPVNFSRPSIDVLFESAAEQYRERLLGILLTGANDDGARGLRAIGTHGGTTIAQDPVTAQASAMPEAAIRSGPLDYVLSLASIAELLSTVTGTSTVGERPSGATG